MIRSYSSLIVFNPAAAPTSSGSDAFLTPSGVVLPEASATLSLQGSLPSVSSTQASQSGVRVVGQGSSASDSGTGSSGGGDTVVVKENAATTMAVGSWMFVGLGSAIVVILA